MQLAWNDEVHIVNVSLRIATEFAILALSLLLTEISISNIKWEDFDTRFSSQLNICVILHVCDGSVIEKRGAENENDEKLYNFLLIQISEDEQRDFKVLILSPTLDFMWVKAEWKWWNEQPAQH